MPTILLVTVTKIEAQAVLELFPEASGAPWQRQPIGDKTYYALGHIGGAEIFMVQSEMGTATPGGSLLTIHKAIETIHPAAVIMVGIAFGAQPASTEKPKGQQMGDILVSQQIVSYEPGKVKKKFTPRGVRVNASTWLLDKFRSGDLDWQGAKVRFGLVLSGEKLVNDLAFRTSLLKLEPEAVGGEMEGAGLYAAASDKKVDWILVKAICDWADGDKDDKAQPLAAHNAAEFVCHVLRQGGWEQLEAAGAAREQEVTYRANLTGDGAIAQGEGNISLGAGAVFVKGDVKGDIMTGKKNQQ